MNYLFNIGPGSEFGTQFELAVVCSSFDGLRAISPRMLPTVTITDGCQATTDDPRTIAELDRIAALGPDALGIGVTITPGGTGAPVHVLDAVAAEQRIIEDPSRDPLHAGLPLVIAGGKIIFAGA